ESEGAASGGVATRPVFVDRLGNASVIDSSWIGNFAAMSVSPDGKRAALSVVTPVEQEVWIKDLPWGAFTKFTIDSGDHFRPIWSSDGRYLRYVRHEGPVFQLEQKRADGS